MDSPRAEIKELADDVGQQLPVVPAAERRVEVDQVQPLRTRLLPAQSGLDRVTATNLSFFMSIPALTAAGLYELKDVDTKVVGWGQLGVENFDAIQAKFEVK